MRTFSPVLILFSALCGAVYAYAGYDPTSDPDMAATPSRGLVPLAGFLTVWAVVVTLLMPVVVRINDGRWDWRKVRTEAAQLGVGCAVLVALLLAGAGVYRLAAGVAGGWPGGPHAAVVGAVIGAAVGFAVRFAVVWLRLFERCGIHDSRLDRKREPGSSHGRGPEV